ncbi:MAG: tetratricopeptide repeat protein, partial [Verrucomicrobiota bacterium]
VSSQAAEPPAPNPPESVQPKPAPALISIAADVKPEPVPYEARPESQLMPPPEVQTVEIQPVEPPKVIPTQDVLPESPPTPTEPETDPYAFLTGLSEYVGTDKIAKLSSKWDTPQAKTLAKNWQAQLFVESAVVGTEIGNRFKNSDDPEALGKAAWWYSAAADAGDITGTYEWGRCQLFGDGVDANPEAAFKSLYRSFEGGNPDAAYLLGICEAYGIGVDEARPTHGRFYLQYARDYGVAEAWFELGKLNVEGAFDPEPKLAWACKLFREGAKAGHRESMIRAAEFYEAGEVITRDLKQANTLRKAAEEADGSEMFDRVRKLIEEKGTEPKQED